MPIGQYQAKKKPDAINATVTLFRSVVGAKAPARRLVMAALVLER
jgi:hypothetical protein